MNRLKEIAKILSKDYPEGLTEDEAMNIIGDALAEIKGKIAGLFPDNKPPILDIWNSVRVSAEALFEPLLTKYDMLKVLYITSKFKNNKNIGTTIVEEGLK